MTRFAGVRWRFLLSLFKGLRIIWPILSVLVGAQLVLGMLIARLEGWPIGSGAYFAFVTGLTIGYGDFVPTRFSTRLIAVAIGFCGILLAGLIAAVGVRAFQEASGENLV